MNDRWCTRCSKSDHWTSGCSLTRKSRTEKFRIRLVKEGNNFYDIRGNKLEIIPGEPKDNELWRKKFKLNASARKETSPVDSITQESSKKMKIAPISEEMKQIDEMFSPSPSSKDFCYTEDELFKDNIQLDKVDEDLLAKIIILIIIYLKQYSINYKLKI